MKNNTVAITHSQQPIDKLIASLELVKKGANTGQFRAKCPVHQSYTSKSRSLSFRETETGAVVINCFAGCDAPSILFAVGLEMSDLFPKTEYINHAKYETRLRGKNLPHIIDKCRTVAMIVEIGAGQLLDGQELSKRDLWILKGAAQDLRELLDV